MNSGENHSPPGNYPLTRVGSELVESLPGLNRLLIHVNNFAGICLIPKDADFFY